MLNRRESVDMPWESQGRNAHLESTLLTVHKSTKVDIDSGSTGTTLLIATYAIPESRCATCDAGNYPLIAPTSDAVIRSSCNRAQVSVLLLMVCMHKLILLPALKEAPVPYNASPCSMALLSCNTRPSQRGRVHNQTLNMIACSDPIHSMPFR